MKNSYIDKKFPFVILCFFFFSVACSAQKNNSDKDIYKIALEALFEDNQQLVIIDSTLTDTSEIYEDYKDGDYEYYDYLLQAQQKRPINITENLLPNKEIIIISFEKYIEILKSGKNNTWDNFYEIYPNSSGIIHISPIGYSKDSTKAWLQISNFKGGYSGFDATIRLEKINTEWKILGDITKGYY